MLEPDNPVCQLQEIIIRPDVEFVRIVHKAYDVFLHPLDIRCCQLVHTQPPFGRKLSSLQNLYEIVQYVLLSPQLGTSLNDADIKSSQLVHVETDVLFQILP